MYEVITVPGAQALTEWERLKAEGRGWPVVVGDDEDLEQAMLQLSTLDPKFLEPEGTLSKFLESQGAQSEKYDPTDFVKEAADIRIPADLSRYPNWEPPEDLDDMYGEWPDEDMSSTRRVPYVATELSTGTYKDRVHILLLPTRSSWEAPAYLLWGGWNACPTPEYHVAAFRPWHDLYGVELVGANAASLELRATRRPEHRKEALDLARDMYLYCPDIVEQGVGTISALAATLMVDDWWFFWWD